MFKRFWIHILLTVSCAMAVLVSGVSFAQDLTDQDTREINRYQFTAQGLEHYTQAAHNLGPMARKLSRDCEGMEGAQSLDEAVSRIDAIPGTKAAITSAGMSTREYMVFSLALFQSGMAAWALSQPGGKLPAGVSKANVDFYSAHEAELQALAPQKSTGDCDDDGTDTGDDDAADGQ